MSAADDSFLSLYGSATLQNGGVGDVPMCHKGFGREVAVLVEALALKGPKKEEGKCVSGPMVGSGRKKGWFIATEGLGCCA